MRAGRPPRRWHKLGPETSTSKARTAVDLPRPGSRTDRCTIVDGLGQVYIQMRAPHTRNGLSSWVPPVLGLLVLGLLLVPVAGGTRGKGSDVTRLEIRTAAGRTANLDVEVADTPAKLAAGLSGRDSLARGQGMLFVIRQRGAGFWMKDVSIPLSVAFVSRCGVILDLQDMAPFDLTLHDSPLDYGFGLEANQGWFEENSVRVGDRLVLPPSLLGEGCR